jgi:hypothetical protein
LNTIEFEVTQEDIEQANLHRGTHDRVQICPTAQALRRILQAEVAVSRISAFIGGEKYAVSEALLLQIYAWDTRQEFEPGVYTIEAAANA